MEQEKQQTQQVTTQPASIMDDLLTATVRQQVEQAKADKILGQTYGPGMGYTWELAALKIAFGRDYGFRPAQSLKFIHVIGGAPSLEVSGRAYLLQTNGYDWRLVRHDENESTYRFYHQGEGMVMEDGSPLIVSFTMADANRAGYVEASRGKNAKPGDKGNYDRVPANMLFARMLANFHRWHASRVAGAFAADPGELMDRVVDQTERMRMPERIELVDEVAR